MPEKADKVRHILLLLSQKYLFLVGDWFKRNHMNLPEIIAADAMLAITKSENISIKLLVDDLDLVSRRSSLIHVKLTRALMDNIEGFDDDEVDDEDRQGSAKVAIMAIERSLVVWQKISCKIPKVSVVIKCLQNLLRQIEQTFPRARDFLRPGFDGAQQ